jgi:virginiamycin B lyase
MRAFARVLSAAAILEFGPGRALVSSAQIVTEFDVPTPRSTPADITAGPDGNVWFTEASGNKIGRITMSGVITEYAVPTFFSYPVGIAAGPDGAIWFIESNANKVGRLTVAGAFSEFPIPTPSSSPFAIAAGPDGNLWFTENNGHKIGKITTSGTITEFLVPGAYPLAIAPGPDGNVWFTDLPEKSAASRRAVRSSSFRRRRPRASPTGSSPDPAGTCGSPRPRWRSSGGARRRV